MICSRTKSASLPVDCENSESAIMYRVFCESYQNYRSDFERADARFENAEPLALIANPRRFNEERENNTDAYKKLSDILYYAEQNVDRYPRLKAFLWTLSSRDMNPKRFGLVEQALLEEQVKLIHSILRLAYWEY